MSQHAQPPAQPMIPAGYELRKKKHRGRNLLIALVVLIALIVIISKATGGSGASIVGTSTVVYSVTSDASTVSATYATWSGGSMGEQQDTKAKPPWTRTVKAGASLVHGFTLVAQENPGALDGGHDGTRITCAITVDGKQVSSQTSTGQYAAVTCSAS